MKFFFCFNQLSYVIAREFQKQAKEITFIIISPERVRCDKSLAKRVYVYRKNIGKIILLASKLTKRIEIIIPHDQGDKVNKKLALKAINISLIDDGLDSFRDVPKNISDNLIKRAKNYYTFKYDIPVSNWTSSLNIIKVCPIEAILTDVKPPAIIQDCETLIFESPGIDLEKISISKKSCLFKHPNVNKNTIQNNFLRTYDGLKYSAEKTLMNFNGAMYVGESMLLVFALCTNEDLTWLHLNLSTTQWNNLSCLHTVLKAKGAQIEIN